MINHQTEPVPHSGHETRNGFAALRIRPAARAVILSADQQILLVRFEFPAGTRWALPGGGLDPGEDHLTALRRELDEELGLQHVDIGPHIWTREHHFPFLNGQWDGQHEHIHLLAVDSPFAVQPRLSWEQLRAEYIHEIRWWSVEEIGIASDVVFVPQGLHGHLTDLITHGPPTVPIDVEP
jgi:8-oxo-dGTP pyrophosphatase MutT (NUDIX family)